MVDARPEEVSRLARPARLEAIAVQLRFDKSAPGLVVALGRWSGAEPSHPTARPVLDRRTTEGDVAVVDSLAADRTDQLPIIEPTERQQLVAQLRAERE